MLVNRPHIFRDQRGKPLPKQEGDTVDVWNRTVATKLLELGIISYLHQPETHIENMKSYICKKRIGLFMHTSKFYSGGRLHLYQWGWCLAKLGHEVWLVTDAHPKWYYDYPILKNLHVVSEAKKKYPQDFDLIATDGKSAPGNWALSYKRKQKHVPLAFLNFETPNWVVEFAPQYASKMPNTKNAIQMSDLILCNSDESLKYLKEYVKLRSDQVTAILPPAVNTFSIEKSFNENVIHPIGANYDRKYVVWSARGSKYKNCELLGRVVSNYPGQLDLVALGGGSPGTAKWDNQDHKIITFDHPLSDPEKYLLFRGAAAVAAPSNFEGFGMVPGEALCSGTPAVVFDLPVLRQVYGDRIVYAKRGSEEDFKRALYGVIEADGKNAPDAKRHQEEFGMDSMLRRVEQLPYMVPMEKTRISAQMICYYGPFVQEALASVYPYVDEILIAYGPTVLWKQVPPDNALELIKSFPDPEGKIKLEVREEWKNKSEMRLWCNLHATGTRMLIVDADEIYDGLDKWIASGVTHGCPTWVHFWHDEKHYVVDRPQDKRWGKDTGKGTIHPHVRWFIWRNSMYMKHGKGTVYVDRNGNSVCNQTQTDHAVKKCPECRIYHLGHVLDPDYMTAKHDFYIKRDGDDEGRRTRRLAWHNWNGELGWCGDGVIKEVNWELPELVKKAFERISCSV